MRRRRYRKRPEPAARKQPVTIECFGVPDDREEVTVHQGNQVYEFRIDGVGRLVTQVFMEDHIACFLARPEMYRLIEGRA